MHDNIIDFKDICQNIICSQKIFFGVGVGGNNSPLYDSECMYCSELYGGAVRKLYRSIKCIFLYLAAKPGIKPGRSWQNNMANGRDVIIFLGAKLHYICILC